MNKKTTKQFYKYYNKWVRPFVIDKGDNLLESEGQLYSLIDLVKEEYTNIINDKIIGDLTPSAEHMLIKVLQEIRSK